MAEKQTPTSSSRTSNPNEDWYAAARRVIQEPASEPEVPQRQPRLTRRQALGAGLVLATTLTAGVVGLHNEAGGNNSPERGELDQTIHSIILDPGANLRNDPFIADEPNSVAEPISKTITIETPHGVRVENNTNNGTWYGIEKEDLAVAIPNAANANDKDGIIWVNEQRVETVNHK